jgi:hypothetical protein
LSHPAHMEPLSQSSLRDIATITDDLNLQPHWAALRQLREDFHPWENGKEAQQLASRWRGGRAVARLQGSPGAASPRGSSSLGRLRCARACCPFLWLEVFFGGHKARAWDGWRFLESNPSRVCVRTLPPRPPSGYRSGPAWRLDYVGPGTRTWQLPRNQASPSKLRPKLCCDSSVVHLPASRPPFLPPPCSLACLPLLCSPPSCSSACFLRTISHQL